jgi:hypothetical protein
MWAQRDITLVSSAKKIKRKGGVSLEEKYEKTRKEG